MCNPLNKVIFMPPIRQPEDCQKIATSASEHVITAEGTSIQFIKYPGSKRCIVFSHGNATDVLAMSPYLHHLSRRIRSNIASYDYFGFGQSCRFGSFAFNVPTEQGCYDALTSTMNHLFSANIKPEDITLVGQSLGTGVTAEYAMKNSWKQPILLISPYQTIYSVILPRKVAATSFMFDNFQTDKKVGELQCQCKIVHGEDDRVIDVNHGKNLYAMLEDKGLALAPLFVPLFGHNDILEYVHECHEQVFDGLL